MNNKTTHQGTVARSSYSKTQLLIWKGNEKCLCCVCVGFEYKSLLSSHCVYKCVLNLKINLFALHSNRKPNEIASFF